MSHVLVVDDERDTATTMAMLIASQGYTVATAGSLYDARRQMALQTPDLVFCDLKLPDGSGMRLLEDVALRARSDIVLVTGHGDVESSIQALRLGAVDYLLKPVAPRQLEELLSRLHRVPARERGLHGGSARDDECFGRLLGRSPSMHRVFRQIERVAVTGVTVLLTGESGSGKELAASTLHDMSPRRHAPFLAVNCGAISPNLMESELFGHEKGSFTGADREHAGLFERADGGTLFLDEITEMPLELQVKLLRVLETGSFLRVGATQLRHCNVRLIAATNREPQRAVEEGRLREDLFYRLNVFPIHLPPLRARAEDIELLAGHFLQAIARQEGVSRRVSPEVLAQWNAYAWPGNVRELRNIVHRAYVMATDTVIVDACLPGTEHVRRSVAEHHEDPPALWVQVGMRWDEIQRQVTLATLEHFDGHHQRTCDALGISVKTLYNWLREWSPPQLTGRRQRLMTPPEAPARGTAATP
ncbi:sigma-54 dependent transcriptional regulator [Piscinibacter sp. XHJ-5]|uniref:sigma-54-dependent transcriptional regulator n=1 Tax=Piscinibacter sp. XHJ-5 TaxID=3037797 RepID=UPI00245366BC|nr:sigma-54 dependent transcriptional regulator [Piscinibacter sp. XHJ-5]